MKAKKKKQFLKRPLRFMLRLNKKEMSSFRSQAKAARLSQVEYGRRKILGIPIAEVDAAQPAEV